MPSKRKIATTATKPGLGAAATAQANAGRSNVAKPGLPAVNASQAIAKHNPPSMPADAVATVPRGVNRTAATIAKQATNYGGTLSERDNAYIRFWASLAKRNSGTVTVADIATAGQQHSGRNPHYAGSAKPHDAGVAVRLAKAGILTIHDNGHRLVFSDAGKSLAAYKQA